MGVTAQEWKGEGGVLFEVTRLEGLQYAVFLKCSLLFKFQQSSLLTHS